MAIADLVTSADQNWDLNIPGDNTVTGSANADAFVLCSDAVTGDDTLNFGKNDSLLTTKKIFDSNNDGIIQFGSNGLLDVDRTSLSNTGADNLTLNGINGNSGLRFLGDREGYYVYADATVRLKGFLEGKVNDDSLTGTSKNDVFFYDTGLGLFLGNDNIYKFGANDRLVTTSQIYDSDNNGFINFGSNHHLDLPGDEGNEPSSPSSDLGGNLHIYDNSGHEIFTLQFDGTNVVNGVTYYIYSLPGGSASTTLP